VKRSHPFLRARTLAVCLTLTLSGCAGATGPPDRFVAPIVPSTGDVGANRSEPGDPVPEPATWHSLAVRWPVRGDANATAGVAVQYRQRGEAAWKSALPLSRIDPQPGSDKNRVPGGWLFAGSIVELAPETEYEVALSLVDSDGGSRQRVLLMRTRGEPREPPGMRVRHVVPATSGAGGPGTGTAADPFRGVRAAEAAAEPGDLILLRAGVYAEGTVVITRHGTPERPIIYRGAGDGETVLDGGGQERLISADHVEHVWFERLTLRNAAYLFVGHWGSHFVIRRCRLEVTQAGITAINGGYAESRGFVITDNVIEGPTAWPRSRGIEGINGIEITGGGHVVAYNRLRNLGDGIHGHGAGGLSASDIHNNDVEVATDDGIEADYADTNVRVYHNRIANVYSGISAQPSRGGPLYIFRNVIYNAVYSPFKLHNDTAGILLFHNTSVVAGIPWSIEPSGETVSYVVTRNNLFLGGGGPALHTTGTMIRCDFDSDGYGWPGSRGVGSLLGGFAQWNGVVYPSAASARRSGRLYRNGAIVLAHRGHFASGLEVPDRAATRVQTEAIDLRLKADSRAVDAGMLVANFNDGFAGAAPDLGCCEIGQPLPRYGPRP
jgi:hypothetical protein